MNRTELNQYKNDIGLVNLRFKVIRENGHFPLGTDDLVIIDDDLTNAPLFSSPNFGRDYYLGLDFVECINEMPLAQEDLPKKSETFGQFINTNYLLSEVSNTYYYDNIRILIEKAPQECFCKKEVGTWIIDSVTETIDGTEYTTYINTCSICGKSELNLSGSFKYCPNCGTKMRG